MKLYLLSALIAFALSFVFCLVLIPILRRFKAGQNILSFVKEHKGKSGTPTMGGLAFITAAVLAAVLFVGRIESDGLRTPTVCLTVGLAYMVIGLLDDGLKLLHRQNLGLRAWQKFTFQTAVAVFCGVYAYRAGLTQLNLPFVNGRVDIGWWTVPLTALVYLSTVNAVNLTDGLDGLAAGAATPLFACLGSLILLQKGEGSLAVVSFCLVGALLAYLLFNAPPAAVFMGDTGSLALGGFAASVAVFSGNALYLPIVGLCFVLSVISVVVQVIYYKATHGRRIFLMSPIHHHFQQKGHSESRISYAYFTVTLVMGLVCVCTVI